MGGSASGESLRRNPESRGRNPLAIVGFAAVEVGASIIRVQANCLVEILDRVVVIALFLVVDAAIAVGVCVSRAQADGFTEILDCAVVIALGTLGGAAVVVDGGQISRRKLA